MLWFDEAAGWTTSSAFTDKPVPWVQEFIDANPIRPIAARPGSGCCRSSAYQGEDDVAANARRPAGRGSFPHLVGEPAAQFLRAVAAQPVCR